MFYSQLLLSKKGALGIIWMAAHCHKRLKKDQVQQTNISSSVDKILDDEVPVVTHRILAFLLLGIVRIYSKKVEYLFKDCHEILNRLRSFKTGKSARAGVEVSHSQRHYHSITLPKRFELDTFDLGLDKDAMGGKVRSHEQDGRRKDSGRSGSFCKDIVPISEAYSAHTPPRDVFGAHHMDQDLMKPSSNANISLAGVEALRQTCRSLEGCVVPIQLDEIENEQMHNKISIKDWTINSQGPTNDADYGSEAAVHLLNNRHHSLPSSGLELMVVDVAEMEQLNNRPSHDNVSPNFRGRIQEEQMCDNLSDEDLRTSIQWPTNNMESDFVVSQSNNGILSLPSVEMLRGIGFTLEDRLEPMVLDDAEIEQLYDRPSNKNASSYVLGPIQDVELNSVVNQSYEGNSPVENLEILHESNFSLEHISSFKLLNSAEKSDGQSHDKPTHEEHGAEEKRMSHLSTQLCFQEGIDQVFTEAVDNTGQVGPEIEVVPPESVKRQKPEYVHVSILNPYSKLPGDVGSVEIAAVQTPGRKERARILKKRKALVDVATMVPNKELKSWIEEDPTDLKRGRKEIPHTRLQVWRAHKFCHAPHSFLEPSIPGVSVDLGYYGCWESYAPETISAKPPVGQDGLQAPINHGAQEQIPDIRSPITEESPRQTPAVRSPVAEKASGRTTNVTSLVLEKPSGQAPAVRSPVAENSPDQIPIAPGTPVAYLNLSRSHEAETVADSDILEPSSSLESIEKQTSSNEQLGLDALFQEESSSHEGDSLDKDAFSARTRITASYLGRKFLHKKRRNEELVLNLSRLLAGKTKKESTIMFYEILVLKTRDCVDVQQETAYRDILLRETPKLRQYFK